MLGASDTKRQLRRKPRRRHRGGIKTNASALLLSLVLLADKPDVALGWLHHARSAAGQQQWDRGHHSGGSGSTATPAAAASPPPPTTTSPMARQRVLHSAALQGRRSRRRSSFRLSGTAGGEPGKTFEAPVVEGAVAGGAAAAAAAAKVPVAATSRAGSTTTRRDSVNQLGGWGVKGAWREAVEQLETERSRGLKPVRAGCCRVGAPSRGMSPSHTVCSKYVLG